MAHRFARFSLVVALLLPYAAAAEPSAPGRGLLAVAEQGRSTVVGRVASVAPVDGTARVAGLDVERAIAGDVGTAAPLRIAWEELTHTDTPRFVVGQRVLVVLEPLPSGSLWRSRFPAGDALAVAGHGDAFLVDPAAGDVDLLTAYLRIDRSAAPATRAAALTHLTAVATPQLAALAVERLGAADIVLDRASATALAAVATDPKRPPSLRVAVLELLGRSRLPNMAANLEVLARPGSPVEAEALIAIGTLSGGLPAARCDALLDRSEPAVRAVGARFAGGALAERRLPPLVRDDPAPSVRAAAASTLAATRTVWGLDAALPALADPDPQVRSAAAQALGALGDPVVPTLEGLARANRPEARGAMAALAIAGPNGRAALRRLAADDSNERISAFARLALGQGPRAH